MLTRFLRQAQMRHSILFERSREPPPFGGIAALADGPEARIGSLASLSVAKGPGVLNRESMIAEWGLLGHG
jgi:hypothetical protein